MHRPSSSGIRRLPKLVRTFATADLSALDASKGDRERIVILGSGWAGQLSIPEPRTEVLT